LYFALGDYAQAETRLARALKLRAAKLAPDHPELAESYASYARLMQAKGDLAAAQKYEQAALAIWEKKFGKEHPAVAQALAVLGELQIAQSRFAVGEATLQRSREIREKKFGKEHPEVAESLHQLGCAFYAERNYGQAEGYFKTAIAMRRKLLGPGHPDVAVSLSYLAALQVATGRGDQALTTFREAQTISEDLVRSVGMAASESRIDALLRFLRLQEEVVYSLVDEPSLAAKAAPLALSVALLRKGRSVDEAAGTSHALYANLKGDDLEKMEELRTLRGEIAHQKLSPTGTSAAALAETQASADKLEEELARRSAVLRAKNALPMLDKVTAKVTAALPANTALVEILAHRRYQFTAQKGKPRWGDVEYTALLLNPKGEIHTANLGPRQVVDEAVKRLLAKLTEDQAPAGDPASVGQELNNLVLAPLQPFLDKTTKLVLSLDGQLNLVPFWALHDGKSYLIDRYELTYVTSGRDLLRDSSEATSSTVAILAKPQFVAGADNKNQPAREDSTRGFEIVEDRNPKGDMRKMAFAQGALKLKAPPSPLAGTEQEAKAINRLLPKARLLIGAKATKENLLGLQAPGILHVATHGLFRPDASGRSDKSRSIELVGGELMAPAGGSAGNDPLLASMLLLANVGLPLSKEQGSGVVLDPAGLAT
ncbi:MAG TPA: tetratricopeptide repeat protein, partial [Polyangia bacterium]